MCYLPLFSFILPFTILAFISRWACSTPIITRSFHNTRRAKTKAKANEKVTVCALLHHIACAVGGSVASFMFQCKWQQFLMCYLWDILPFQEFCKLLAKFRQMPEGQNQKDGNPKRHVSQQYPCCRTSRLNGAVTHSDQESKLKERMCKMELRNWAIRYLVLPILFNASLNIRKTKGCLQSEQSKNYLLHD